MAGTRGDRNPGQRQRSLPLPTDSSEAEGPARARCTATGHHPSAPGTAPSFSPRRPCCLEGKTPTGSLTQPAA